MKPDMKNSRGVTLVELVIVIIVIGIMAAVMAPLALSSLLAYENVMGDVVVLDKLRYTNERLVREIREVNYTSPTTGFAFTAGTGMGLHTMQFTRTSFNAAGVASTDTVTVGNTGSEATLAYSSMPAVGAQVLTDDLNGLNGLTFKYFLSDGVTPATDAKDVRMVQIELDLKHNGSSNYTQLTQLQLKNIN